APALDRRDPASASTRAHPPPRSPPQRQAPARRPRGGPFQREIFLSAAERPASGSRGGGAPRFRARARVRRARAARLIRVGGHHVYIPRRRRRWRQLWIIGVPRSCYEPPPLGPYSRRIPRALRWSW
ncbi:hypothetical protein T484DRAFT_1895834, partial [Baffinella frigidus]